MSKISYIFANISGPDAYFSKPKLRADIKRPCKKLGFEAKIHVFHLNGGLEVCLDTPINIDSLGYSTVLESEFENSLK